MDFDFNTYKGGALDLPDERDYTIEELGAGEGGAIPTSKTLDWTPFLDQGSVGACSLFGSAKANFETFAFYVGQENYFQPYDTWKVWNECKKRGASDVYGWSLQGALQVLKDFKHISAYIRIVPSLTANLQAMKRAIATNKAIATGVKQANWGEVGQAGHLTRQNYNDTKPGVGAHIFPFTGYDDTHKNPDGSTGAFYSPNNWGGACQFWLSYKDVDFLFSQYTFFVTPEQVELAKLKDKREGTYLLRAKQKGVWNEERPDDLATPREIRIMLNRALDSGDDTFRKRVKWADIFLDKILRGKWTGQIWNMTNPEALATDNEVAVMFTRAEVRNSETNTLSLSRKQVAVVIGRDFLG